MTEEEWNKLDKTPGTIVYLKNAQKKKAGRGTWCKAYQKWEIEEVFKNSLVLRKVSESGTTVRGFYPYQMVYTNKTV